MKFRDFNKVFLYILQIDESTNWLIDKLFLLLRRFICKTFISKE
ncbi:hypothetical protein HMPREF9073_02065 [Capnocytophaga sp. oral taxon 326 str. F0382]|nr:hypothetical protein HMPREF9073_02065 [Capnocytophaga sp. oral taxon 326 str. F0382]